MAEYKLQQCEVDLGDMHFITHLPILKKNQFCILKNPIIEMISALYVKSKSEKKDKIITITEKYMVNFPAIHFEGKQVPANKTKIKISASIDTYFVKDFNRDTLFFLLWQYNRILSDYEYENKYTYKIVPKSDLQFDVPNYLKTLHLKPSQFDEEKFINSIMWLSDITFKIEIPEIPIFEGALFPPVFNDPDVKYKILLNPYFWFYSLLLSSKRFIYITPTILNIRKNNIALCMLDYELETKALFNTDIVDLNLPYLENKIQMYLSFLSLRHFSRYEKRLQIIKDFRQLYDLGVFRRINFKVGDSIVPLEEIKPKMLPKAKIDYEINPNSVLPYTFNLDAKNKTEIDVKKPIYKI